MKDKFGRDVSKNDIVLIADGNDLKFGIVLNMATRDMMQVVADELHYVYPSVDVIKIEELPIDVRDALRGELKLFEWLTSDSPIKFQGSDSFFDYTCNYIQYRFPHLSKEVCTALLVKLNTVDPEFYDCLWEKFCENEAEITGQKTESAVINISTNR